MRRAFVIQLDRKEKEGHCEGRIEHVDSSKSMKFHSLNEAVSFVNRVLLETEQEEGKVSEASVNGDPQGLGES